MTISLTNTGKRFNRDWIFRHLEYQFISGNQYAITGPNGSGKSTLLQVIAGAIASSEGKIEYLIDAIPHPAEEAYKYISIATPYLELVEEMTLQEFLEFHQQFKPFRRSMTIPGMIATLGLEEAREKQIRYFSSGMKQRVKLGQAVFSDTPALLLDEPCTNLDAEGVSLYQGLMKDYSSGRLVIVSSNDEQEYRFCEEVIDIRSYK